MSPFALALFLAAAALACSPPPTFRGYALGPCDQGPAAPDVCEAGSWCLHYAADPESTVCADPCRTSAACPALEDLQVACVEGLCLGVCESAEDCLAGQECLPWGGAWVCAWPVDG